VGNPTASPSESPSESSIQSAGTQLAIIADSIGQYRARVADLANPFVGTTRDDLVTAIHEAERQLRNAERGLIRAARLAT
jgi:cob(I)alamin adenosyltransferase